MYAQFVRFLAPLVIATVVLEIGGQVLNGGMARVPRATETLAAFGLALGLTNILGGPLYQTRQVGLGLVDNVLQLRTATRTVFVAGVVLSFVTAVLGLPGPGRWIVQDLHRIDGSLAAETQFAILCMAPLQLLQGLSRFYSGLLARHRRTEIVSASSISGIGIRVASVFLLVGHPFVHARPILLPVIVTAFGAIVEYGVLAWGLRRYARPRMPTDDTPLTVGAIVRFLWPLAVIMTFQGASRPLINLVVSRGADATEALAVLTVVYALGHIHYGWVNDARSLAPAFRDEPDSLRHIRRFIAGCLVVSVTIALILFWTPVRAFILLDLIGVDASLAALCAAPLMIFSFFPFAVTLRAYYHGLGILRRVTQAMAISAPSRITAISVALLVFSFTDVAGATRGIGALFCGFAAEALAVAWGVRRKIRRLSQDANTTIA